ncbi:YbjQ family protein [Roseovarius pelagicus]|uniref:YbjQ family protein n=1 Tax=Roseovarius pelagicus TaxID=2980108 RepID=A0ABY6D7L4_9RHOB|nr:YbjQ family protein [Roseovarius pelagicus]UXX82088.1 YbjQ family protein [Roseovarius pelagicus]
MGSIKCTKCGKEVSEQEAFNGRCGKCHAISLAASARGVSVEQLKADREKFYKKQSAGSTKIQKPVVFKSDVITTTEVCHDLPVKRRLAVISAEIAIGMNVFKDIFIGVRNFVGGRSATMQNAIKDMRKDAYSDLKQQAAQMGANAVVGISESYLEIGNTGSTMLLLVVNGTAVELRKEEAGDDRAGET